MKYESLSARDKLRVQYIFKWHDELINEINGQTYEQISKDPILVKAIKMDLAQIGEHVINLPKAIKDYLNPDHVSFFRRTRNLIIHEYEREDFIEIYNTMQRCIGPFIDTLKSIPAVQKL